MACPSFSSSFSGRSMSSICLCLLLAASFFLSLASSQSLTFTAITLSAPFLPRSEAFITASPLSISIPAVGSAQAASTAPAGSLVLWGGITVGVNCTSSLIPSAALCQDSDDTWLSSDGGLQWSILSGVSNYTAQALVASTSQVLDANQFASLCSSPVSGALFSFSGQDSAIPEVFVSTNGGSVWSNSSSPAWSRRNDALCLADPHSASIVLLGGDIYGGAPTNQAWLSTDSAASWTQLPDAAWSARGGLTGAAVYSSQLGTTLYYVMTGNAVGSTLLGTNDVFVSSNLQNWTQLTAAAPFPIRTHARATSTVAGILILTEGAEDETVADSVYPHDIWASMDGGATWGQCSEASTAQYGARRNHALTLDSDGFLIIATGELTDYTAGQETKYSDVWKSGISFNDVNAVATACGLPTPAAASCVGPRCWPIGSNCPCTAAGSASSSSSAAAVPAPSSSSASPAVAVSSVSAAAGSAPLSSSASPSPAPVSSTALSAVGSSSSGGGGLSGGAIAGIIVGCVVGIVLLLLLATLCLRRRKADPSRRSGSSSPSRPSQAGGSPALVELPLPVASALPPGAYDVHVGSTADSSSFSTFNTSSSTASSAASGSEAFPSTNVVYVH